ncbi:MAG: aminotransferase class V-fold PLP-dependent enzyme [Vicinamibacterales bacterium]
MLTRRSFLGRAGLAGVALAGTRSLEARTPDTPDLEQARADLRRPAGTPEAVARDEAYWRRVASQYRVATGYTNLEAGYFGMMAAPVLAEFHRQVDRVNLESSHYARIDYPREAEAARARTAAFLGATPGEIAITRGATEALQRLIIQYLKVGAGDEVMYADLDYGAMQYAMNALAARRGAKVITLDIPEPATRDNVLAAYEAALDAHPRVKLLLLTHLNNKTGLIVPVKDIAAMARARGADVVVDAAHSFGQVDLKLDDLGADFVGCNLHKWIGAPVGVGVMYIRAGRLGDIERMLGDEGAEDRIDSRLHTGTTNFATTLTVPAAIDFHEAVGSAHKAARIRYLRDRWVGAVRGARGIDVLTPDDRDLVAGISSFRLNGRTGAPDNRAIATELLDRHGIFVVARSGLAKGDCVRVTPALYNTPEDCDRLATVLREMAGRG